MKPPNHTDWLLLIVAWVLTILFLCSCGSTKKNKQSRSQQLQQQTVISGRQEVRTTRENNISENWVRENFEIPAWLLAQLMNIPVMRDTIPGVDYNTPVKYNRENGSKTDNSTFNHYQVNTWKVTQKLNLVIRQREVIVERNGLKWWAWLLMALAMVFLLLKAFYWDRTKLIANRFNPFK